MVLSRFFSFLFLLAFISSCQESSVDDTKNEPIAKPDGKVLYTLNCASCHGVDGKLGMSGAKDITETQLSDQEIKNLVENGKNGMPSFKELLGKPGEIDAVINYISKFKKSE